MNKIALIKAEIKRLYDGEAPKHDQQCDFDDGYFTGIGAISIFLDTLEEEPDKSLEEAAEKYANKEYPDEPSCGQWGTGDYEQPIDMEYPREVAKDAFIAGAKWQADHTHLPEDTVLFQKGVEEGKRLMMEGAMEGEVENAFLGIVYLRKNLVDEGYSAEDKVRVIIVKED